MSMLGCFRSRSVFKWSGALACVSTLLGAAATLRWSFSAGTGTTWSLCMAGGAIYVCQNSPTVWSSLGAFQVHVEPQSWGAWKSELSFLGLMPHAYTLAVT